MTPSPHLSGIFDAEPFGLAAFVTDPLLPLPLQLSVQAAAGLLGLPHLPFPVHPQPLDLFAQVALGFDGLAQASFLGHPHKLQLLQRASHVRQ